MIEYKSAKQNIRHPYFYFTQFYIEKIVQCEQGVRPAVFLLLCFLLWEIDKAFVNLLLFSLNYIFVTKKFVTLFIPVNIFPGTSLNVEQLWLHLCLRRKYSAVLLLRACSSHSNCTKPVAASFCYFRARAIAFINVPE